MFSITVYVVVALLANWNVWVHGLAHTLQASGGADTGEEVWFLAQTPWALVHGVNPLTNAWINVPAGLNLMDNTTMPLLGLLGSPITLTLGPIATLNVLVAAGLAGSAAAFYVMARRFVGWWPAAFVGGLLYGFSPYAVASGRDHLFEVFAVVPPLVVLVVAKFLFSRCEDPWLYGIALGGCFAAQFYISTEGFASLAVMSLVAIVVGGFLVLRRWQFDAGRVVRFGLAGGLVLLLLIGFGAWTALSGPRHINGPAQSASAIAGLSNDPAGLVVPTTNQHFSYDSARGDSYVAQRDAQWRVVAEAPHENGSYVGVTLLTVLTLGIVVLRRNRLVVFAAIMAAAAMVLSMGTTLHVDGHLTGVPLPFTVLAHLPLLDRAIASRYVVYFWLFAALILCFTLDRLHELASWRRILRAVACLAVAFMALLPLVPAWPYPAASAMVPTWFTSEGRALPTGTTIVVYPSASPVNSSAMIWQAMADMTFKMPGGYAVFASSPAGVASFDPTPSPVLSALELCQAGQVPTITPEERVPRYEAGTQPKSWWRERRAPTVPHASSIRHWAATAARVASPCGRYFAESSVGPHQQADLGDEGLGVAMQDLRVVMSVARGGRMTGLTPEPDRRCHELARIAECGAPTALRV